MTSRNTLSITEIQNKYEKRKIFRIVLIIFGILALIFTILFTIVNSSIEKIDYSNYFNGSYFLILLIFFLIGIKTPTLSTHEEIRYYLSKLIENLNIKNYKKAEYYLNKLAYNTNLFIEELEDTFLLHSAKEIMENFMFYLKFVIYPDISNKNRINVFLKTLEEIDYAFSSEDITYLYNITNDFKDEKLMRDEITFSYEKTSLFSHITLIFKNIINYYPIKFFIIYLCVLSLLSGIVYYFSTKLSFIPFDGGVFAALIVVSVPFTEKIKIK